MEWRSVTRERWCAPLGNRTRRRPCPPVPPLRFGEGVRGRGTSGLGLFGGLGTAHLGELAEESVEGGFELVEKLEEASAEDALKDGVAGMEVRLSSAGF